MDGDPRLPGPSRRDWLLLLVGVAFTAVGLLTLHGDRGSGIVTIVFFGSGVVLSCSTIVRKIRDRTICGSRVRAIGGVRIRQSRAPGLLLGTWLLLAGTILLLFGKQLGAVLWVISWMIAAAGGVVLLGAFFGLLPTEYIQFDPEGLTIARGRWAFLVPWDEIARVSPAEIFDNPALFIWLKRPESILAPSPAHYKSAMKYVVTNEQWYGTHVVLMPSIYRMSLPLLGQAIARYAADPSARSELAHRQISAQGGAA